MPCQPFLISEKEANQMDIDVLRLFPVGELSRFRIFDKHKGCTLVSS